MADGFRITESGDSRVLENGTDSRITERVAFATASLSGAGTASFLGGNFNAVSISLSGSGTQVVSGDKTLGGIVSVSGSGTATFDTTASYQGVAPLSGAGSAVFSGGKTFGGQTSLSGSGTLTAQLTIILFGFVGFIEGEIPRETESGDTRILENGTDTRIVGAVSVWTGYGSLSAVATRTPFPPDPYVKHEGSWKSFEPYVKYEGDWVKPRYIYVKKNDVWTRTY